MTYLDWFYVFIGFVIGWNIDNFWNFVLKKAQEK
jgi:hypothetical protein